MPSNNYGAGGFAGGSTTRNVPVLSNYSNKAFWVDSNTFCDAERGTFDKPVKTIAGGISLCTASKGDIIYVKAYHAENLSTAAIFAMAKAGVKVIGLGDNKTKPTFTSTGTAGAVMITAANCVLENLRFVAGVASVVQAIDLDSASHGTIIRNCDFRDSATDEEFLIHVDINGAITDVIIEGCTFITYAGSMTSSIFFDNTSRDCFILNNQWFCDCSASVVDHLTADSYSIQIHGNRMANYDTDAGLCLSIKSNTSATGYLTDNYIFGNKADAEPFAVTNDFIVERNIGGDTQNSSGALEPATSVVP